MISITIDVTIFDLSEYYNVKMHNFKFFGNGEHPYILWSVNDHEIPNTLRFYEPRQNLRYALNLLRFRNISDFTFLAMIFNSTIIEMCEDMFRISYRI